MKIFKRVFFEEIWSIWQWFFLFIPGRIGHYVRGFTLGIFFKSCGGGLTVKENVEIYHPENLSVGRKSGFGRNNVIDAIGGIDIGSGVRLGPGVMIATMNHASVGELVGGKEKVLKKVVIGNNCWVGNGVTILPGVKIGNNCIIAAGAVVSKDVPNDSTVGGVPAKIISKCNIKNAT